MAEKKGMKTGPEAQEEKDQSQGKRGKGGRRDGGGGRKPREQKEFDETILKIDRVTRVVKGGRRMRFRVSIIIGDHKGRVGFGIGKAAEVMVGVQKAVADAKKNMISVPIYEDSIPHGVSADFKASKVILLPAPEGTGVIAGGAVRKVLELAGVKNVFSKVHGARNLLNVAYATFRAVAKLQNKAPKQAEKAESTPAAEGEVKGEKKTMPHTKKEEKPIAVKKPEGKKEVKEKTPVKKAAPKK